MIKIAVSGCLLGEKVRFDGGHKRDEFITDELSRYVEFLSFCPEHIAFGSPRPSMRLVKEGERIIVSSNKDGSDITKPLEEASKRELFRLEESELCGIIFKSRSPSCSMGSAKLYQDNGYCESSKEDGIFAAMCKERFGDLPMEEEGRLNDAWLRENFVMDIFARHDMMQFCKSDPNAGELVKFHQSYKFLLYSKNEVLYRELGNIVANHDKLTFAENLKRYESRFYAALKHKSSIKKSRSVLEHMAGFVKKEISQIEKEMLHTQIVDFYNHIVPIIVPLSTLELLAKKYNATYLLSQKFLHPYPKELALRSELKSYK